MRGKVRTEHLLSLAQQLDEFLGGQHLYRYGAARFEACQAITESAEVVRILKRMLKAEQEQEAPRVA